MGRMNRMKFYDADEGYYHLISRTVQGNFMFGDIEKAFLLKLLSWLSGVYFVEIGTFSFMSNHFHLVVKMINPKDISREDLQERFDLYYNRYDNIPEDLKKKLTEDKVDYYYNRFSDVSKFIQDLKQRFSKWYNYSKGTFGHVWAERFTSVMLEGADALLACMIYVDLNSVRAGIVQEPEKFKYSGLAHFYAGGRKARWLSSNLLKTAISAEYFDKKRNLSQDPVKTYYMLVYREGMNEKTGKANIPEGLAKNKIMEVKIPVKSPYLTRIRHFSEGLFIGSRKFCENKFVEFHSHFQTTKSNRRGHPIWAEHEKPNDAPVLGLKKLYSIRSYSIKQSVD